jgi:TolB-like protein
MAEEIATRRLAAILAADVVAYSRMMERDEAGTLAALKARRRDVFDPTIARHVGRIVKIMGDGVLVEFASAVNAVQCAVDLQGAFASANRDLPDERRIVLRIGINLGDVLVEGDDLYGDGINVAARLEAIADAGGIFVARAVYDQVRRKLDIAFDDLGARTLKNIADPVTVYRVRPAGSAPMLAPAPTTSKPSVAVLPFSSMSTDPDQETFCDGMTEDLITDLSRQAGLFVIARHSTFAYKGKALDARRIADELGVRYLLEGSARRAAGRVRINVQLIDATGGGGHLWAERFDRGLEDVFAVQDEVIAKIVEALVGQLIATPARNRTKNMEAYDLCVRARVLHELSPQDAREGRLMLERAIALDPSYAEAHAWLALNYWLGWAHWGESEARYRPLALATAEKALTLDPNLACCHWILGMVLAYEKRWAESDAHYAAALEIDPSNADAWAERSDSTTLAGRVAEGMEQITRALRLNPHPPVWYFCLLGMAQYAARDYARAIETLRREETYRTSSRKFLAAALALGGQLDEAKREAELFLVSSPHFTVSHWVVTQPLRDDATREHFVDGMRKAGLPE